MSSVDRVHGGPENARYTGRNMRNESLKPCPACGKAAGEMIESKAARFPFQVQCRARGYSTDAVKLEAVAMKLWNEAKREGKPKAPPEMKPLRRPRDAPKEPSKNVNIILNIGLSNNDEKVVAEVKPNESASGSGK